MSGSPRRARVRLVAALATSLAVAMSPAASAQSSMGGTTPQGVTADNVTAAQPATQPTPPASAGCVNAGFATPWDWIYMSAAEQSRTFDAIKATGATYIRIGMEWGVSETAPGVWDWSKQDQLVNSAAAKGLQIVGLVNHSPTWASRDGVDRTPATDVSKYAAFAGAAAARYSGRVSTFEVWNEPNISVFWTTGPNAAQYVQYLKAAYTAIKTAQPGSTVISAGLSPAFTAGGNISPTDFVNQMYAAGAGGYFDALGMHPYGFPANPADASTSGWNTWFRLADVHNTMVAHGDGAKKIWLTEFGAPTGAAGNAVSESKQAEIYSEGLRLAAQTSYLGPLFFYTIRDLGTNAYDIEDNFGLYKNNWTPKSSLATVTSAITAKHC